VPKGRAQHARSATPIERLGLAVSVTLLLGGCISAPVDPTTTRLGVGDCLRQVEINRLRRALERCDAVVETYPQHPQPRNERALLYSLKGDNQAACKDSQAAARLLERFPKTPPPDPLMVEEIRIRQSSCRSLTTAPAGSAPSPAKSDA
jgi:hypothetical protein